MSKSYQWIERNFGVNIEGHVYIAGDTIPFEKLDPALLEKYIKGKRIKTVTEKAKAGEKEPGAAKAGAKKKGGKK
jgi:hypothetical protein